MSNISTKLESGKSWEPYHGLPVGKLVKEEPEKVKKVNVEGWWASIQNFIAMLTLGGKP